MSDAALTLDPDAPCGWTMREVWEVKKHVKALEAEIARLRAESTAHDVLMELARDPACPHHLRLKAAAEAAQYETPKLSANMSHSTHVALGIGDALDRAKRLRLRARGLHVVDDGEHPAA